MIILKFGGTSVGSAQRIRSVAHLTAQVQGRKILTLSAMSGTTDTLVKISTLLKKAEYTLAKDVIFNLEKRYKNVIEELFEKKSLQNKVLREIQPIFNDLKTQSSNEAFTLNDEKFILSRGEILSTTLMQYTLLEYENIKAKKLNALTFMRINHKSEPDPVYIKEHLLPLIDEDKDENTLFLTEGYICTNAFGEIDNLRRGGSDYTATLIGEATQAKEVQIWTDIDGLHNNDPRIVNITSPVRQLYFGEAADAAHFGAKILHPACIEPARRSNIPVRLLYTLDPKAQGTHISSEISRDMVKVVSAKDQISLITLKRHLRINGGPSMPECIATIAELLSKYNIETDVFTNMGDNYLIAVEETPSLFLFCKEAEEYFEVLYQQNMTIIAVVGNMGWERMGFEVRILEAVDDIPIRAISYGCSNYSLVLVVAQEDKRRAMIALSDHLFSNLGMQTLELG